MARLSSHKVMPWECVKSVTLGPEMCFIIDKRQLEQLLACFLVVPNNLDAAVGEGAAVSPRIIS